MAQKRHFAIPQLWVLGKVSNYHLHEVNHASSNDVHMKHLRFPKAPKSVAQKFHFAILQIEVTRTSRSLSAIAELLVNSDPENVIKSFNIW